MHSFTNLMAVLASLELWINFKTYLKLTHENHEKRQQAARWIVIYTPYASGYM